MSQENECTPERMIEGFESMSESDKAKVKGYILGSMIEGSDMPKFCMEMMQKYSGSAGAQPEGETSTKKCC